MPAIDTTHQSGTPATRPFRTARMRRRADASWLLQLHRWIGLTLGALFAMAGLTGSYLAFYPELEQAAIAPLRASPGARPASLEALYGALSSVASPDGGGWSIELAPHGGVITARFAEKGQEPRLVSIDPVTLAVVRDVRWGATVSTWIYELHYHLLLGRKTGAPIMGIAAIGMIGLLVAGILLWWRSGRTWRSRLRVAAPATRERRNYDLHRLTGTGASLLLLGMVATAAMMSLPAQTRSVLAALSPVVAMPKPRSQEAVGRQRIPVDQAVAAAGRRVPQGEARWVAVPNTPAGAYAIRYWQPSEPSHRFPRSTVWVDQYDGRVLGHLDLSRDTASNQILGWLYGLHSGQAFGTAGRAIVAILGLVPAILFVTGLIRWRAKAARISAHRRRQ